MTIDIDNIITVLSIFSKTDAKFFHNTLGISDKDAELILIWAEDIVDGYIKIEEEEWDVPDVISDLLLSCKFHNLNSPQALLLLLHGYHVLSSVLEPSDFFNLSEMAKSEDFPTGVN